jgi:cytochrome c biogenesis protein CcmG/thiol:disulfide interchange protein DsbE
VTRVRWIVTCVAVVVIGIGIVLAASLGKDHATGPSALLGKAAPAFSLAALGGNTIDLKADAGKVVIVNYWNDWCIPCQQELGDLQQLWSNYKADPLVAYVGIVHDAHARRDITSYIRKQHITFPVAFDPGETTAIAYGVTGQPETFVVDAHGVVRNWISGPIDLAKLEALVEHYKAEG